jgi:chorismate mutase/prephenate dehydratase
VKKNISSYQISIDLIRTKIDAIDSEIVSLIEKRERCAIEIAKIKKQISDPPVFYVPEREQEIISRIAKTYKGNFSPDVIVDIFKIIILNCRLLQNK